MRNIPTPNQYRAAKHGANPLIFAPVLALVLSGCAEPSVVENPTPHDGQSGAFARCKVENPDVWERTPGNVNMNLIASKLHTTVDRVAAGMYGQVACASGVSVASLSTGPTVIVEDIAKIHALPPVANECQPLLYEVPPSQGATSYNPVVLCPAAPDLHAIA